MSKVPQNLRYAPTHEWALVTDDCVVVGITDFAQLSLGDIVFVELPEPGTVLVAGDEACVIESVKAASEIYAPVSGKIESINETLADAPETINKSCYEDGWLFRIIPDDIDEIENLLKAARYKQNCEDDDQID